MMRSEQTHARLQEKFKVWNHSRITRRSLLFVAGYSLVLSTTLLSCSTQPKTSQQQVTSSSSTKQQVVRIVGIKQLVSLTVLRKQGTLEKRLKPLGFKVEWPEFAAGPQQLEALNAGSLDIAHTAESPPVFAQAAGAPLVYLATSPVNAASVSFLVPVNSPIKSIADFKGKKIAFQKASIGHYVLVKALEDVGLTLKDIESVYLPPPDANVAFSQGKVDAWIVWDPFVTRAVQRKFGRVLKDSTGYRDLGVFYSTSRQFYQAHPEVIKVFLEELEKVEIWCRAHRKEMADIVSPEVGIDVPTLEQMYEKLEWGLQPITEQIINKQEGVAKMWYNLGLVPKLVNVREGFLSPEEYAKITPSEVLAKHSFSSITPEPLSQK